MKPLRATTTVDWPPGLVYAFLADLRNHWRLTGRGVTLLELNGNDGGKVVVHGPLGTRRTVRTRVLRATPISELEGEARLGRRTTATVCWTITERAADGCEVKLEAALTNVTLLDRVLLALGGRRWLGRLFRRTVEQLPRLISDAGASTTGHAAVTGAEAQVGTTTTS